METMRELFSKTTIAEMRAAGRPLVPITVGFLADNWSQGSYKPGELLTPSGAILDVTPLTDELVSVEFENGMLSASRSSTVKVFD